MKYVWLVLLIFTLLSLLIFWPIFLGKVNLNGQLLVSFYAPYGENLPFKNTGWDQLRIYFPFLKITLDSIGNWQMPLWNPYAFSGHPHMADFQTAVFYPLNIFGFFLGQIEFWHLLRITPTILAAFFTFLYLRSLKLSQLASFFGGMTFGFSPFILTWGEEVVMSPHSIVWLPLILLAIEKFLVSPSRYPERSEGSRSLGFIKRFFVNTQNDKAVFLAIIALSTAFSFFGGYIQTSIYMFLFILAYLLFRIWSDSAGVKLIHPWGGLRLHLRIFGSFSLGILLAAVQLLPSAELYFNAARSEIALREQLFNFLLPIESLLTYLAPDIFGHPATANFFRRGDAQYYEGILFVGLAALIFAGYELFVSFSHLEGVKALRYNSGQAHPRGEAGLTKFLVISGLIALLTTLDTPIAKLFLSLPIPFLSTSIPNRVLFIPAFCLAVLAALGFEKWLNGKLETRNLKLETFKPILIIAGIYVGILVTLGLVRVFGVEYFQHKQFMSQANLLVSLRNLVIPLAVLATTVLAITVGFFNDRLKRAAAVVVMILAFGHIFYFSQKYFSFSDRKYVFGDNPILSFIAQKEASSPDGEEQGYFRSWGIGEAFLENNFASLYGVFWPEGYDSLNNRAYAEFTYVMQGNRFDSFVFRADAGLGRGKTAELVENSSRRRLVDMVGVKYVIGKEDDTEVLERNGFKKVFGQPTDRGTTSEVGSPRRFTLKGFDSSEVKGPEWNSYAVFENLTVMPRAFLASNYEGPPDIGDEFGLEKLVRENERRKLIFEKLLADDFDWRNVLILEKPSPISPQFGEGTAQIASYKPQEVIVRTKSDQPKLLFLSDNWYPGWKATVDGDETEILRANYTFRAVPLTRGEHEVRFYYDSETFKVGLSISLLSLGGLVFFGFNSKFKIQNSKFPVKS